MKTRMPLFDVGLEVEFFLTKDNVVYNASKKMEGVLGFSIDQNKNAGQIVMPDGFSLVTDGTAAELRWFRKGNQGRLPDQEKIEAVIRIPMFYGMNRKFIPIVQVGDRRLDKNRDTVFDDQGTVFASEKKMHNAYTDKSFYSEKKDGGVRTTTRTAGIHLHFSPCECYSAEQAVAVGNAMFHPAFVHSNNLVKMLDDIYNKTFVESNSSGYKWGDDNFARCQFYQKLGDYRIKWHSPQVTTLEYRQLDSSMNMQDIQHLVTLFQYEACKYFNGL